MFRKSLKYLIVVAVVTLVLSVGSTKSEACWGRWCWGWGGGWSGCCWNSCYTVGYYGYVPFWQRGPVRRLVSAPWRPWGWCANCCSYDCCCDTVAVCQPAVQVCAPTTNALQPTPAQPQKAPAAPTPAPAPSPSDAPQPPTLPKPTADALRGQSGLVTIWVPEDAKVYVNGYETKSTGARRQYVSRGLKPGYSYNYQIRAVVVRDGKPVEEVRTVALTAGQQASVAFRFTQSRDAGLALVW